VVEGTNFVGRAVSHNGSTVNNKYRVGLSDELEPIRNKHHRLALASPVTHDAPVPSKRTECELSIRNTHHKFTRFQVE